MTVTYHRFPNPGITNITKARAWVKFCWPNKDCTSVEVLHSLHITSKVLCGRHFKLTQFYDNKRQKLSKFAVPDSTEVEELLNDRENILNQEHGTISTKVTSDALVGEWTVDKIEQGAVSPLFLFDAFDTFKIMFKLKVRPTDDGLNLLIQAKGTYGGLPEQITVSLCINKVFQKTVDFVLDTKWMHILSFTCVTNQFVVIDFRMHLPYTNISKLFSPETNFANLWENPGADITIEAADGKQRNVHKTVLLARSDVFRAMWQNEMLESKSNHLKILELNEDSLDVFITYLYRGSTEHFNLDQCSTMLRIAHKYNISDLLTKCQNMIYMNLTNENVIDILTLVELYNLSSLKARAFQYLTERIVDIIPTKAWREANNASFFKLVYAHLIKTDSREVTSQ